MIFSVRIKQLALLTNNSIIGSAASYFLSIYIANNFGVEKFGFYSYILVLSSFSLIFINWSTDQTAPSFFAEGMPKRELFNLVLFTRFLITIIVTIVLFYLKNFDIFLLLATMAINVSAFNLSFIFEISGKNILYSYIYMFERLAYVLIVFSAVSLGYDSLRTIFILYFIVVSISLVVQYFIFEQKSLKSFSIPQCSQLIYFLKRNSPVVVVSFSSFVYGGVSRLFIEDKLGIQALGLFASGMQITVLASIFQAQVERIWRLPLYEAFSEKNAIKIKSQILSFLKLSTLPTIFGAMLLAFLSNIIVDILFSEEYAELKNLLPIITLFFITTNIISLLNICWFALRKNNEFLLASVFMSGILFVIFFMIPSSCSLITYILSILFCQTFLILYSSFRIYKEIRYISLA